MLDPFIQLLLECLDSMHVKVPVVLISSVSFGLIQKPTSILLHHQVITEALVAFTWLLRFPLPAVEQNAEQLTKHLFVLLKDYSKAGAARGENYQLVQNCFKVTSRRNA